MSHLQEKINAIDKAITNVLYPGVTDPKGVQCLGLVKTVYDQQERRMVLVTTGKEQTRVTLESSRYEVQIAHLITNFGVTDKTPYGSYFQHHGALRLTLLACGQKGDLAHGVLDMFERTPRLTYDDVNLDTAGVLTQGFRFVLDGNKNADPHVCALACRYEIVGLSTRELVVSL